MSPLVKGKPSEWYLIACFWRWTFCLKHCWHRSHTNGRSPVCISWWRLKLYLDKKDLSQKLHSYLRTLNLPRPASKRSPATDGVFIVSEVVEQVSPNNWSSVLSGCVKNLLVFSSKNNKTNINWAVPCENRCIRGQRRCRSACASMQSDQGLHCPQKEPLDTSECINGEQKARWYFAQACSKAQFHLTQPNKDVIIYAVEPIILMQKNTENLDEYTTLTS